jgi:hypothetical protein
MRSEVGGARARAGGPLHATTIMGTAPWHRWLARFAIDSGGSRADVITAAVALLAEHRGYAPPPPRLGDGPDGGASRGGAMIDE